MSTLVSKQHGTPITVRLSARQRARIEAKAARAHATLSDYARKMLLSEPIYDAELGEAYRKLFLHVRINYPGDRVATALVEECFRLIGMQLE
jgi:hypothetical protein